MAASEKHKPETHWDQTAFEKLKATWTPERIAEDDAKLKEIFALAADCPLLAEALDWAEQHDIKFFIDRNAVNCGAYYTLSTGVMALTAKTASNPAYAVGSIVHEIRHAWQDYQGFVGYDTKPFSGSFSRYFINTALVEADAMAYGERARDQYKFALLEKNKQWIPLSLHKSLSHENTDLIDKFLRWFPKHEGYYGDYLSKFFGQKWDLYKGALPERRYEFSPQFDLRQEGININNIQDVLRLGVNFSGTKNYLAALQPDILPKQILRPSLADVFWGAANKDQKKLTAELRKAHLKKKLAGKKRRPGSVIALC